jgi:hypothetical protein
MAKKWILCILFGTSDKLFCTQKMAVVWVVAPCSLVEVYQRFRGPYCLHHQGDDNQTTRRYNPEAAIFVLTARRENLKSDFCTWLRILGLKNGDYQLLKKVSIPFSWSHI